MTKARIVNTNLEDLDFACQIFDEAIEYQKRKGYPLYLTNDRAIVENEIKKKLHFKLMIEGEIACVFSISYREEVIWREKELCESIYLHRIITNQKYKGRKLLGEVLDWAVQLAHTKGKKSIRLDTWANNPPLVNYYQSFGFKIIEYFIMPEHEDLSVNCWGNEDVLMEFRLG